ncbi:MAG TPA: prepilin-type N-terminal cleavage/methylation domain-containing protein [Candidatus Paceibacterota bacterium]|nr:prepilin-type N-terminal cleavage/methylation domain-containing protein [Candidatus Paceibacterota bacterium]
MNVPKIRWNKGFTLVELLVVIAIIGVLATLVLLQLGTARARARDTKRITDINQIRTAVEQYFEDNDGHYPATTDLSILAPKYITRLPADPLSGDPYNYAYNPSSNPTSYQIWTTLEQSATALNGSSHINSTGWQGKPVDASGASQAACTASPGQAPGCIYDQGIQ